MRSEKLLLLALILSMCIWGMSWSSAKVLSDYAGPTSLAFLRFAAVPVTLIPLMRVLGIKVTFKRSGVIPVTLAGGLMLIYTLLFFRGLQLGLSGTGGVLVTTMNPIFSYLIGILISRIVPGISETAGLLLGLTAGVIQLELWQNTDKLMTSGSSFFLVAALVWAVMSKISSRAKLYGNPITFTMWLHVFALVGLSFIVDFRELAYVLTHGDTKFWLNIIYFGIINSGLATTCFLFATTQLGAERTSSFIFIVPGAAVFSSWLFLGEPVEWATVFGGILGITAVLVINGRMAKWTTSIRKRRTSKIVGLKR